MHLGNPQLNRDFVGTADDYQTLIGNQKDFLATRVAYKLNLKGPELHRPDGLLDLAGRRASGLPEPAAAASATWRWPAASQFACRTKPAISTRRAAMLVAGRPLPGVRRRKRRGP